MAHKPNWLQVLERAVECATGRSVEDIRKGELPRPGKVDYLYPEGAFLTHDEVEDQLSKALNRPIKR